MHVTSRGGERKKEKKLKEAWQRKKKKKKKSFRFRPSNPGKGESGAILHHCFFFSFLSKRQRNIKGDFLNKKKGGALLVCLIILPLPTEQIYSSVMRISLHHKK